MPADKERLATAQVGQDPINLSLQRSPSTKVWLVSEDTVADIPEIYAQLPRSPIEGRLPPQLVKIEVFGTALWRWIALILVCIALYLASALLSRLILAVSKPVAKRFGRTGESAHRFEVLTSPLRLFVSVIVFAVVLRVVGISPLTRLWLGRVMILLFFVAIAWFVAGIVDLIALRLQSRLDARQRAISHSVIPLGVRVIKTFVFFLALLAVLSGWNYNVTTILAGLGVGGVALALAAQKTLENFFGGVSIIADRPVLVGDFCRFEGQVGTVEDIGLRSTRIRTLDRTLVTVPNGTFSTMTLENFSKREKIWFNPKFGLRLDSTTAEITKVMESIVQILRDHPKMQSFTTPVRFTGITSSAFTFEVFAYVLTSDVDAFLAIQSELLLKILDAIHAAGTEIAIPITETALDHRNQGPAANAPSLPQLDGSA